MALAMAFNWECLVQRGTALRSNAGPNYWTYSMRFKSSHLAALLLLGVAAPAFAQTTICKIEGDSIGPELISWDTKTQRAQVKLLGEDLQGKMTWKRKHDDLGDKVNLSFTPADPLFGDEYEFVVFPTESGHRVMGVGYKYYNGVKYLNISQGNYAAVCSSL